MKGINMYLIRKLVAITVLSHFVSNAQGNEYSDKLVEHLNYKEQFENVIEICLKGIEYITPESLLINEPNYFYGLNESSNEWPEVVDIYKEYYNSSCRSINVDTYLRIMSKAYESFLTKEQLLQAIDFYSSPVGIQIVKADVQANISFQTKINEDLVKTHNEANEIYTSKLLNLVKKAGK